MRKRLRRSRAEDSVQFDFACGDSRVTELRSLLDEHDRASAAAALQAVDPVTREFLVERVVSGLEDRSFLDKWVADEPTNSTALLVRGAHGISWAWEARGRDWSDTVGRDAWDNFFERLRGADADLEESARLNDDGVAWSFMVTSARGLQLSKEELRDRHNRATASTPGLVCAADALLQGLCAKWSGSHDEMFAFARSTVAVCGRGDPRFRLIPTAHFERALAMASFENDGLSEDGYRQDDGVQAELRAALRDWDPGGHSLVGANAITLNVFAMALVYFYLAHEARPLFERIGNSPTPAPWDIFGDGSSATFAEYRGFALG